MDAPEVLARFHSELSLVRSVARQVRSEVGGTLNEDELLSFGQAGLLEAARKYDPDRGVSFRRFARYRVRGAILDGLRSQCPLPRRTHEKVRALQSALLVSEGFYQDNTAAVAGGLRGSEADARLAEQLATIATAMALGAERVTQEGGTVVIDTQADPEQEAETNELMAIVRTHLASLQDNEAVFIKRHFLRGEDVDDIARGLGLSKSWGSRILSRGLAKLTKKMQDCAR